MGVARVGQKAHEELPALAVEQTRGELLAPAVGQAHEELLAPVVGQAHEELLAPVPVVVLLAQGLQQQVPGLVLIWVLVVEVGPQGLRLQQQRQPLRQRGLRQVQLF